MLERYGDPQHVVALREVGVRKPAADEVLVRIHAASINPIDLKLAHGDLRAIQRLRLPVCLGFDVAGEVIAAGASAGRFRSGAQVFLRSDRVRLGAFAEQGCFRADWVASAPKSCDLAEAASLPLVGLTTVQGLRDRAGLASGQSILIHAGSGGVGTFAVQFARMIGVRVAATCSRRNAAFVESLGAERVICYDEQDYRALPDRYDCVFDLLGGEHTLAAFDVLNPGGSVVSIAGPPDRRFADQVGAGWLLRQAIALKSWKVWRRAELGGYRYFRYLTEPDGGQLAQIADWVDAGAIRPVLDARFAFADLKQALARCASGRARGKVVVEMQQAAST